jgi:sulfatase maturation enzyme AslB (radical SAM superfamily)
VRVTGDLGSFVAALQQAMLAERGECSDCEFLAHCGGYFKWPRKDYRCSGVKTLFHTLRDAGEALRRDLDAFIAARKEMEQ